MPYRLTWNHRYVVFEYFGNVTSEDLIESNKEVYGDPRFDQLKWELVLFEETESISCEAKSIRLIAYMDQAAAHSNPNITIAFVGKSKILAEVEAAYNATSMPPAWPSLIFDSKEDALAYIEQS